MSIIQIANLTSKFQTPAGEIAVVNDVSFDVGSGETVALVGESGSGKSVTALSILRLLPRFGSRIEGSVRFGETNLLKLSEKEMLKVRGNDIAMIFQEPMTSLNPVHTVGRQISEALMIHRGLSRADARAETLRILDRVRIPSATKRIDEFPHQFSGGMRQRVMIAMALACRPRLLIADEPTTALDVTIQEQILNLIKALQEEEGMAVLFITHDMGVVAQIADRVVVMYKGKVVETGRTEQIFEKPVHPYTRSLLSVVPKLGDMSGTSVPAKFPIVDPQTGIVEHPAPLPCTVRSDELPVLVVKNLTTRFDITGGLLNRVVGRVHAVENVSFDLAKGETLSLVGESGCGKSTTGRSILGLVRPKDGEISVDGKSKNLLDARALREYRRSIQMIFQDPFSSLNPRTRVGDAIAEPLAEHGWGTRKEIREKVAYLLDRVGLPSDSEYRYPHEFSGGQRQRICIARALALDPKVIVADESVSALDVSVKAQIINLLLEIQENIGVSYLFISHDMAVVERVSHRVAVMYLGEIVEIGPRNSVLSNPQHPYTQALLSAVPVPDPARRRDRSEIKNNEIKSPIRPPDYNPPHRQYKEINAGHFVQV